MVAIFKVHVQFVSGLLDIDDHPAQGIQAGIRRKAISPTFKLPKMLADLVGFDSDPLVG